MKKLRREHELTFELKLSCFLNRTTLAKQGCAFVVLLSHFSSPLLAQQAPDAGQTFQELQPRIELNSPTDLDIPTPKPSTQHTAPGGRLVKIAQIKITGNTALTENSILESLGEYSGVSYDLAGLRNLAFQVSNYYDTQGYPFVEASLPEQDLTQGILEIAVTEGRYGDITVSSENSKLQEQGQPWLSRLREGSLIEKKQLESTLLILEDQPGIKILNTLRAGGQPGAGDLNVSIVEDTPFKASVEIDNHGNRYTGYYRTQARFNVYNNLNLGDELAFQGIDASERLQLGSLGYSTPLGTTGLRGKVRYALTRYELGREFASSQASGTATELGFELSKPLIRNRSASLTVSAGFLKKHLRDENINGANGKSSRSHPVSLQFYQLGGLGGGLTFGDVSWTHGSLDTGRVNDTLNTAGSFNKYNINLIRLQSLSKQYTLYLNFNKQLATRNLDSSEGYSLGGPAGVRAYPIGEANGDEFWLTQAELRYISGPYTPFVFYDYGSSRANAVGATPTRSLSGLGVGIRVQYHNWLAETMLAWRGNLGGSPQADTSRDPTPRVWLKLAYSFH